MNKWIKRMFLTRILQIPVLLVSLETCVVCAEIEDQENLGDEFVLPNKQELLSIWNEVLTYPFQAAELWINEKTKTTEGQNLLLNILYRLDNDGFSPYLTALVHACFGIQSLWEPERISIIKQSSQLINTSLDDLDTREKPEILKGKFTYLKTTDEYGILRHVESKTTVAYTTTNHDYELVRITQTDALFILGANGKTYIAYDVREPLQRIKSWLLTEYDVTFLRDLEGKETTFSDSGDSIVLSNQVSYPLAKFILEN